MEDLIAYLKEEIATAPGECFVISKKQAKEIVDALDNKTVESKFYDSREKCCEFINSHKISIVGITESIGYYTIFYISYE